MKRAFKKAIKQSLKPRKPFEAWAREHNIVLPSSSSPSPQKPTVRRRLIIQFVSAAACVILFLGILLPVLLLDKKPIDSGNPPAQSSEPRVYLLQDAVTVQMDIEELYAVEGLILFDASQIYEINAIYKNVANDNNDLILSYILNDCVFISTDEENVFFVTCIIRIYPQFEFFTYEKYTDLNLKLDLDNVEISYRIVQESRNGNIAYLKFLYGNAEYFLQVTDFEGITDINEETLKILMGDLISI